MGPTPKTSVKVVPEARTAAASFFFASRIWLDEPLAAGSQLSGVPLWLILAGPNESGGRQFP
jgi:hypothetical protein